ncbi:ATP-binding protein [Paenibacillus lautus]|uniref:ATP-binding protein n=1 Tax=Paenibacillus lautus TaxID=1401 RepID=UPI00384A8B40
MGNEGKLEFIPSEILNQENRQLYEKFVGQGTVIHELWGRHYHKVLKYINEPIIVLTGPSHVGKTTVLKKLYETVTSNFESEMAEDPGMIPAIYVEAKSPEKDFRWLELHLQILQALNEPEEFLGKKLGPVNQKIENKNPLFPSKLDKNLRHAVEIALNQRKTHVLFIDEAQHLGRLTSDRKLAHQMDYIKSLVNRTNITIVLAGSYELAEFMNQSAQLSNRSTHVHFHRYRFGVDSEMQEFANIIGTFQKLLPVDEVPDLTYEWEYFASHTAGCAGILKKWFNRALKECLYESCIKKERAVITLEHFRKTQLTTNQILKIANDALTGEQKFAEDERRRNLIFEMFTNDDTLLETDISPTSIPSIHKSDEQQQVQKRKKTKPGQRKPTRDIVGDIKNAQSL